MKNANFEKFQLTLEFINFFQILANNGQPSYCQDLIPNFFSINQSSNFYFMSRYNNTSFSRHAGLKC